MAAADPVPAPPAQQKLAQPAPSADGAAGLAADPEQSRAASAKSSAETVAAVSDEAIEEVGDARKAAKLPPADHDGEDLGDYLPTGGAQAVEDLTMPDDPNAPAPPPESAYAALVTERKKLDETVWKNEVLAQEHEQIFTWLWDRMIDEENHVQVLAEFPFADVKLPQLQVNQTLDWGIQVFKPEGGPREVLNSNWGAWLKEYVDAGYELVDSEWHHLKFDPATADKPAQSTVNYTLYVQHAARQARYQVKGSLLVSWSGQRDSAKRPIPSSIDATNVTVHAREGKPAFEVKQTARFPIDKSGKTAPTTLHPLLLHDFNQDGSIDLAVGGYNRLYLNDGQGNFHSQKLVSPAGPKHTNAGLMADLNGDTFPDLTLAVKQGPVVIHWGDGTGNFSSDRRNMIESVGRMVTPSCIAAGDIDGDHDLDLFITQLRPPYLSGKVPVPFFDANDGFPAYLLVNDGSGNFSDVTELSGLGPKRFRRTFSATFVDLDLDRDQDLIVVSDFCGLDVYLNNGKGGFDDVTSTVAKERSAFGMSHTFGDYNLDGRLDFYMIGMSSTTARRLDHMGLKRDDQESFYRYADMRQHMGYGNRMFLSVASPQGLAFEQAPWNADVARTGWSWGSTTFDFDNDSDPDIFVANGQLSGKTTKDYCTRFWCHDIYIGNKIGDAGVAQLINEISPKLGGNGISWNGFEHDALFMNLAGHGFVNISYLMNCDLVGDGRCVVSGDLDHDGKMDLVVEQTNARTSQDTITVLKNTWESDNAWIGFRLLNGPPGKTPLGCRVLLELSDGTRQVGGYYAGHSVWTQHPAQVHFGLGKDKQAARVTFEWADGTKKIVERPEPNRYHVVGAE